MDPSVLGWAAFASAPSLLSLRRKNPVIFQRTPRVSEASRNAIFIQCKNEPSGRSNLVASTTKTCMQSVWCTSTWLAHLFFLTGEKLILTVGDTLLFGVLSFFVATIVCVCVLGCVTVQVWLLGSSIGNYERCAGASLCLDIIASVSSWLSTSYLCLLKERTLQNSLSQGDIGRKLSS